MINGDMGVTKKQLLIGLSAMMVIATAGVAGGYLLFGKGGTKQVANKMELSTYGVLAAQTSLPLYATKDEAKYRFMDAKAADDTIVIATYETDKGIINVTNQPKPTVDPFLNIDPVDKFATSIGDARLYPDDQEEPYLVVYTPLTWVIIRSTSDQVASSDLKAFALSLRPAEDSDQ
jgi:hypothetical protein